jgi:alanine racemase
VFRPPRAVPADAVRPTRAEINLANLRHNLRVLRRYAPETPLWGVLKADAYGHGAKAVARTLERAGVDGVCVALLEEGIELRQAGIRAPILVMGGYYGRAWGELVRFELTPVVYEAQQIEALSSEARFLGVPRIQVHLKLDTGMGRLGAVPAELGQLAAALRRFPEVELTGLMTHFACADSGEPGAIDEQLARFEEGAQALARSGFHVFTRHAANSAALLRSPRARLSCARPGVALFGIEPYPGAAPELRPVMRIRTEIVALRDLGAGQSVGYGATWRAERPTRVATVPIGYADGMSRGLSNRGHVLVRGKRAPIIGVVSMDMLMLDVTDVEGARAGDECVCLGPQKGPLGQDSISAVEVADALGTIPWEVLTNVSRRVPRFYREP